MTEPALFDVAPYEVPPIPDTPIKRLSPDRRRTLRQAEAITRGGHPLGLTVLGIRVHPDAESRTATRDNTAERPIRCGTCRFREQVNGGVHAYPKCMWRRPEDRPDGNGRYRTAPPRYSAGPGTDVRGWWPGCTDWEAAS